MKIGIVGPAHPLRGGLADYDERLARELQHMGHEVTLWSFSLQYPGFLFPGSTQYTSAPPPADLRIRTVINSVNPFSWLTTGRAIRKDAPDLLIVRYWLPFMGPALGTILRIAKKNGKTKVVAIADNILPHEKRPGDKPFTRYFIGAVDAFITMSDTVLQDVKRLTPKPVLQLHHPLYDNYGDPQSKTAARQKLGLDPDGKYALFFGFIRKYKGLDLLYEAMANAAVKAAGIQLIVAGEYYTDRSEYEALVQRLGIQDRLRLFTDFIPNEEVGAYFSAADVVVLPYRSATNSGITQIAIHFLKPMIATRVGGLAEIVHESETGLLCNPDPASIADALLRFFEGGVLPNPTLYLQREKEQLGWRVFAERLLAFAPLPQARCAVG